MICISIYKAYIMLSRNENWIKWKKKSGIDRLVILVYFVFAFVRLRYDKRLKCSNAFEPRKKQMKKRAVNVYFRANLKNDTDFLGLFIFSVEMCASSQLIKTRR